MIKNILFLILINCQFAFSQIEILTPEKLNEDLITFRNIRESANSGLYKYRTKAQIDSIYTWANNEIKKPLSTIEFYKIICQLTDFEGSVHNETNLSADTKKDFISSDGYFPIPVKLIQNNLVVNTIHHEIPLASKIHTINDIGIEAILKKIKRYYTTDGYNVSGKTIGINAAFSRYYKYEFGPAANFRIEYSEPNKTEIKTITIKSVSDKIRSEAFLNRHSKSIDSLYYTNIKKDKYKFELINQKIAILTVNTFAIGQNSKDPEHIVYKKHLDSCFSKLNRDKIAHLIIDVRTNGGGTDPNDILLFSYLANKKFRENKSAYVSFQKIPYSKYLVPEEEDPKEEEKARLEFENEIKEEFPNLINGKYYQTENFNKPIEPNENAFKGKVYLLISERIASAGSLFAALVASNTNAITIGQETMGGYFGHNGHIPIEYQLPNSKITTMFSIVNLEQDVIKKKNQKFGRGVIPDIYKSQTLEEFINNEDDTIKFTLRIIGRKK